MQGQEKEMLSWYFWHSSYSGNDVISNELLEIYTRSISKPGFLRSMFQYFAAAFADATYFTTKVNAGGKLQMPVLVMGGEALFSPAEVQQAAFEPVAEHLSTAVVPKSGHWIVRVGASSDLHGIMLIYRQGDENPAWVAQTAMDFFNSTNLPPVDVAWLRDSVSLSGGFGMSVILTPGINGTA